MGPTHGPPAAVSGAAGLHEAAAVDAPKLDFGTDRGEVALEEALRLLAGATSDAGLRRSETA